MTDGVRRGSVGRGMLGGATSRREVLRRAAALGLGGPTLAAALGARAGVTAAPRRQEGPAGTIRIGQPVDINTLDPHQTATVPTDLSVISHLYTSLVLRGPDLALQPALATAWEATSETTWTFTLRDDVSFPNGEKLDAAAVKWNVERVLNPETQARIASWFDPVTEVRAPGATTVEFVTASPYPALADQLSMFFLLPPQWTAEHDPASEAMGSGRYDLVEWVRDDHVTLEAKADYWGEPPTYQTAMFFAVPENSSRVSGLLAGDFEVVMGIPPADFGRIDDSGQATAGSVASTRSGMVKFNTLKPPLDNQSVRQALNYAVDKQLLVDALLEGLDVPLSQGQILTEHYFGFNPELEPYPYDPDQARQMLADAGFGDGFAVEFDVPSGRYLLGEEISQAIAGQLAEVGVTSNITEMPFSVFMDKMLPERNMAQLVYLTLAWPTIDADGLLTLFETGNQYTYWDNAEFTDLLAQARSTTDQEQRRALYAQATSIMREAAPVIFLFPQPATYATANTVAWQARADDWVRVWEMTAAG